MIRLHLDDDGIDRDFHYHTVEDHCIIGCVASEDTTKWVAQNFLTDLETLVRRNFEPKDLKAKEMSVDFPEMVQLVNEYNTDPN